MRKLINICAVAALALTTSCYEDYVSDFDYSTTYFSSQNPLRTVISDRDMEVKVGVAIGGKREVNESDYAIFELDEILLDGTGLTLLPETHYEFGNSENKFTVEGTNVAVADIAIAFTDDFYNDPLSLTQHYALPFRVIESSLDSILPDMSTSVVAIKYISTYSGSFYVRGKVFEVDGANSSQVETYYNNDVSKNEVYSFASLATNKILRSGVKVSTTSTLNLGSLALTFNQDGTIAVEPDANNTSYVADSGSASYEYNVDEYSADEAERLEIMLEYQFTQDGKTYRVEEEIYRRQDPLKDLRYEEWQ